MKQLEMYVSNPTRIYVVGHIATGHKRLVRATNAPQAARHAMRTSHAVTVATQDELVDLVRAGIRPAQVVQLRKIYTSLKDGMSSPGDWFDGADRPDHSDKAAAAKSALLETDTGRLAA